MSPLAIVALFCLACALVLLALAVRAVAEAARQLAGVAPILRAGIILQHDLTGGAVGSIAGLVERGVRVALDEWHRRQVPVAGVRAVPMHAPPDPEQRLQQELRERAIQRGIQALQENAEQLLGHRLPPDVARQRAEELLAEAEGSEPPTAGVQAPRDVLAAPFDRPGRTVAFVQGLDD